jgi:hypothetical protein
MEVRKILSMKDGNGYRTWLTPIPLVLLNADQKEMAKNNIKCYSEMLKIGNIFVFKVLRSDFPLISARKKMEDNPQEINSILKEITEELKLNPIQVIEIKEPAKEPAKDPNLDHIIELQANVEEFRTWISKQNLTKVETKMKEIIELKILSIIDQLGV